MKRHLALPISLVVSLGVPSLPASAQTEAPPESSDLSEGLNLLEQGTQLMLRGLMEELGPALKSLKGKVIDLNAYQPPEVLPNGDILIRRKPEPLEDGEVEL